ncbi:hypothetical protein PTSG_00384 [Salpingoeca rosetta]|uniref:DNA repair protein RAD51 homolog 3 n=1 Tax=Salpingoeca rosetta (strain ATCC 50818 / BSB-021) TaxID=946362 RepID=F2TWB8_SALR5|nr:uncharacterized protein PTSG_00384 [Salpingoeca rosetta]EGD72364.1 hypothetical protein PTSG_00384 [Salpingoeca rosetta]|eukprot:XP_004998933.1 hypothetical protein PTSG_00384 [Salpingoeca rosetta]
MSRKPVSACRLTAGQTHKLARCGYETVGDLEYVTVAELSKELEIGEEEAAQILRQIKDDSSSGVESSTVFSGLRREEQLHSLSTLTRDFDELLGGGIEPRKLTEFCGAPGAGKTQLAMQLSVNCQLPHAFGGLAGQVVYIDTEGSFMADRFKEIAEHTRSELQPRASRRRKKQAALPSVEEMLEGVHVFRVHNYIEQIAVLNALPAFQIDHPQVKLVVIDSIAFHFRADFHDMGLRTRLLNGAAQQLLSLATQHNIVVLITNQMTTTIKDGTATLIPALGETWAHACTTRVVLAFDGDTRSASLFKSPSLPEGSIHYSVTAGGVRSVRGAAGPSSQTPSSSSTSSTAATAAAAATTAKRRHEHS